jgi:E3 ubiquitin-protein ligase RNF14
MTSDSPEPLEDERTTELSSIAAIFPEIILDPQNLFSASIDLSVVPSYPLPVVFPEPSESVPFSGVTSTAAEQAIETHHLSHLPSLHLEITLPEGYPTSCAPNFTISTSPQWLSDEILDRLEADGRRIWEELGHGQVVFAYIDHLQQAAENAFTVLGEGKYLQVSPDHKISLLDYDIKAKHAAFEKETFHCGVCLGRPYGVECGGACTNRLIQIQRKV